MADERDRRKTESGQFTDSEGVADDTSTSADDTRASADDSNVTDSTSDSDDLDDSTLAQLRIVKELKERANRNGFAFSFSDHSLKFAINKKFLTSICYSLLVGLFIGLAGFLLLGLIEKSEGLLEFSITNADLRTTQSVINNWYADSSITPTVATPSNATALTATADTTSTATQHDEALSKEPKVYRPYGNDYAYSSFQIINSDSQVLDTVKLIGISHKENYYRPYALESKDTEFISATVFAVSDNSSTDYYETLWTNFYKSQVTDFMNQRLKSVLPETLEVESVLLGDATNAFPIGFISTADTFQDIYNKCNFENFDIDKFTEVLERVESKLTVDEGTSRDYQALCAMYFSDNLVNNSEKQFIRPLVTENLIVIDTDFSTQKQFTQYINSLYDTFKENNLYGNFYFIQVDPEQKATGQDSEEGVLRTSRYLHEDNSWYIPFGLNRKVATLQVLPYSDFREAEVNTVHYRDGDISSPLFYGR